MPDRVPTHAGGPVPGPPDPRPVPGPAVPVPPAGRPPAPGPPSASGPTAPTVTPPAGTPTDTGDPRVPEALAVLDGLASLPPAEHVARLEDVHRLLQDALASLDGT